ncbi:MAG: AI-2E family transporter [Gammaproteobacteria bacterium]|nr:AI-2E family transporter [Gammaproteobacteria bacterium]
MIEYLRNWYRRHFSDPQVAILTLFLILGFALVLLAGSILAPVLAGIVIAYLLDGAVEGLCRNRVPRRVALAIVFMAFVAILLLVMFLLIPLLLQQITQFFRELPGMIAKGQEALMQLPEHYPDFISEQQLQQLIGEIRANLLSMGHYVVSLSLSSVTGVITIMVYLILVPLLVFFFLKDKRRILVWLKQFLPERRDLVTQVWYEVNLKIGRYVRGKVIEILIVWLVSYVTFAIFGLNYTMLLSFMVGLSVIVPIVGAAVVTIPIAFIAYFQWGLEAQFAYVMLAYAIIQFLDSNVLGPLLFSEVVNLHPIAIIVAVLVFGGIWGVWGVFFSIPLATLVHAVINAWPTRRESHAHLEGQTQATAASAPPDESETPRDARK